MNMLLRPIIETAGYTVVDLGEAGRADVVVTSADRALPQADAAVPVVKIRADPDGRGQDDDSIYRYDRTSIISALTRHARASRKG
jgi:hypothetical protein